MILRAPAELERPGDSLGCPLVFLRSQAGAPGRRPNSKNGLMNDPTLPAANTISYNLGLLHTKLDEVAERAGVAPSDRMDLETCLAALPWRERRRLALLLESVRVHAMTPGLQDAVRLMLRLAADVWAKEPPPPGESETKLSS
jgi:hypothetical protein